MGDILRSIQPTLYWILTVPVTLSRDPALPGMLSFFVRVVAGFGRMTYSLTELCCWETCGDDMESVFQKRVDDADAIVVLSGVGIQEDVGIDTPGMRAITYICVRYDFEL